MEIGKNIISGFKGISHAVFSQAKNSKPVRPKLAQTRRSNAPGSVPSNTLYHLLGGPLTYSKLRRSMISNWGLCGYRGSTIRQQDKCKATLLNVLDNAWKQIEPYKNLHYRFMLGAGEVLDKIIMNCPGAHRRHYSDSIPQKRAAYYRCVNRKLKRGGQKQIMSLVKRQCYGKIPHPLYLRSCFASRKPVISVRRAIEIGIAETKQHVLGRRSGRIQIMTKMSNLSIYRNASGPYYVAAISPCSGRAMVHIDAITGKVLKSTFMKRSPSRCLPYSPQKKPRYPKVTRNPRKPGGLESILNYHGFPPAYNNGFLPINSQRFM